MSANGLEGKSDRPLRFRNLGDSGREGPVYAAMQLGGTHCCGNALRAGLGVSAVERVVTESPAAIKLRRLNLIRNVASHKSPIENPTEAQEIRRKAGQ